MYSPELEDINRTPKLDEWTHIKARGALVKTGDVYLSPDTGFYLRTGIPEVIHQEADFAKEMWDRGFPVPEVVDQGILPNGQGYFTETSIGERNFSDIMHQDYLTYGAVQPATFKEYQSIILIFLEAQLKPKNIQSEPNQLFEGVQAQNVIDENPDFNPNIIHAVITKTLNRISVFPLVFCHGDFTGMNIMENGIIDFERHFIAPFGYDAISATTFQRFWDHSKPDGTGIMKRWDVSRIQLAEFLSRVDELCRKNNIPPLSEYIDDFLTLKSIWALSYERHNDPDSPQARRWAWRKKVALYCCTQYLANESINSELFIKVGLS